MRLCWLADALSPHIRKWVRHYCAQGHSILLISSRTLVLPGVKVIQLPMSSLGKCGYVLSVPWVRREVEEFQPDIVHGHYLTSYGGIVGRVGRRPFVLSAWGSDVLVTLCSPGIGGGLARWFDGPALRGAAAVTVESPALVEPLARLGVPPERIEVLPWGIDLNLFNRSSQNRCSRVIDELTLSWHWPVILGIRSLKPVYNATLLLSAFSRLLYVFPRAVLVLLAGVRDQAYYRRVLGLIASLRVQHCVRVVTRLLEPDEVASLLGVSDVAVSVPQTDSLSVSVLEAAASCVPLVLSRIPSNEHLVDSGLQAHVVDFDSLELKEAIEDAVCAGRAGTGSNRTLVREQFSWQLTVERMDRIYTRVLENEVPRHVD